MATNVTDFQFRIRENATGDCGWGDFPLADIYQDTATVDFTTTVDPATGQRTITAESLISLDQELFGAGETLPASGTNNVTVTLSDGTTAVLMPGDVIPANLVGAVAFDEVSNRLTYIGMDTNTFASLSDPTAGDGLQTITFANGDVQNFVTDVCEATANDTDFGQLCF